jgi:hypothetical protein
LYTVKFPDGKEAKYAANIIAENMLSLCDQEGNQYLLLNHINDHKKEVNAVPKDNTFVWICGRKYPKKTTKGWKLCVEWKDGTASWVPLSTLKESNPVEIEEYVVAYELSDELAFCWWAPFYIRLRQLQEKLKANTLFLIFANIQRFALLCKAFAKTSVTCMAHKCAGCHISWVPHQCRSLVLPPFSNPRPGHFCH